MINGTDVWLKLFAEVFLLITNRLHAVRDSNPHQKIGSLLHWTIVLHLQDEMCPSSQTSTLFTKALDFSRYCCGSGRIRTYSARRQRIYSPPQLWRTPLNNGINKTQTQSRSLNVSEYKDSVIFRLYKVNNVKFCNNQIYYYIPLQKPFLNALLIVIYLHRPITADKCNFYKEL